MAGGSGLLIAIDGPAGVGKSTLARRLSRTLGLPYVNTGMMYRAVAAEALRTGVDPNDAAELARIAEGLRFTLANRAGSEQREGEGVGLEVVGGPGDEEITSPAVEAVVSRVAAHHPVRQVLRAAQRRLGARGAVMEGRDIGSVVFPDADVKILLVAGPEVRSNRRASERGGDARAGAALAARDALDQQTVPLEPGPDTRVIDTTGLDAEEVYRRALQVIRERVSP